MMPMEMGSASGYAARHPWLSRWLPPVAVATMMGCLAHASAQLLQVFYPPTLPLYFVLTAVSGVLLGYGVYRLGQATIPSEAERRSLRLLVLVAVFLILKGLSFAVEALAAVQLAELPAQTTWMERLVAPWLFFSVWLSALERVVVTQLAAWAVDPRQFFDLTTLLGFACFLCSWSVALATARDFARIGVPSEDRQERPPLTTITQRFLTGGVLLLLVAGMARTELWGLWTEARPSLPNVLVTLWVYVILGFGLVAYTHLLTRVCRWQNERARIADDLAGRWLRYGLAFMAGAAALALMLPTRFTLPLLDWGRWLLWLLMLGGTFLFYVLNLVFWPLGWLLSWLFRTPPPEPPEFSPQPPPMLEDAGPDAGAAPAPQWLVLRTLIVLMLLFGGLFYLFRRYLDDHPEVRARLVTWRPLRVLREGVGCLWAWLQRLFRRTHARWREVSRRRRAVGLGQKATRHARHRSLPEAPREQVLHAYLVTLDATAAAGLSRRGSQTPDEYENALVAALPIVQTEVNSLTQAFDVARYSVHPLTTADAARAQLDAQRIMETLAREAEREGDAERGSVEERERGGD